MHSHGDCLYRYALLRVRVPELAAELVQETFLEALRGWGSFAGRSSEHTWLVGILKHRIVDHLRRTNAERAASGESSSRTIDDKAFDARTLASHAGLLAGRPAFCPRNFGDG